MSSGGQAFSFCNDVLCYAKPVVQHNVNTKDTLTWKFTILFPITMYSMSIVTPSG